MLEEVGALIEGPWYFDEDEQDEDRRTLDMSADLQKKPYAQSTIDGLKAVRHRNDTRRERAINTLSRLAFPGRARRQSK